jgi:hypothetical protein
MDTMTTPTRAFIVGNSHTAAIKSVPQRDGIEVHRITRQKDGTVIGDLSVEEIISRIHAAPEAIVVSVIGGNQHQMFLMEHPQPFDFMEPGNDDFTEGYELIPYQAVYDHFERGIARGWDGRHMKMLRDATRAPVYHLEVPPPKADEAHMRKRIEGHFQNDLLAGKPFTKAPIRAKFWRVQRAVTKAYCDSIGVTYLPVPEGTKIEGDFLAPAYYAKDATHANAAYGALVLDQIERLH